MKFNFFKSNRKEKLLKKKEEVDYMGFTQSELEQHDKNVEFYYTNIINSLILYTYTENQLNEMAPILIDPLTELYEELDYAFTPILFETVFKKELIDNQFKAHLLKFKAQVDEIPSEIWDWEYIDNHEIWLKIRLEANDLLNKLDISTRKYNAEFTTIISNKGDVLFKGMKTE